MNRSGFLRAGLVALAVICSAAPAISQGAPRGGGPDGATHRATSCEKCNQNCPGVCFMGASGGCTCHLRTLPHEKHKLNKI